jgi:2-keto-4-pentenoate hydratase/2-oxohepta-3-ene-1,7-dioic acid hydratase in catechol pathway
MKLFRFGPLGREVPGVVLEDGTHISASDFGEDYGEAFFATDGLARLASWLKEKGLKANGSTAPKVDIDNIRFGAPIMRPGNIICIGLNYSKHAEESGLDAPKEPVIFFKHSGSYAGPFDEVPIPRGSEQTDWEVELGVVIRKPAHNVAKADWKEYVAGYTIINDVSERQWQLQRGPQWANGKGFPGFTPIGPYFVTADEISNPNDLKLWLEVNGIRKQDEITADMIFDVPTLIEYCSTCFGLLAGDLISTGTPSGVGLGQKPEPAYLQDGDVVRLGIEGLGEAEQTFRRVA